MKEYLKIYKIPEAVCQYYLKRSTNTTFPETEENEDYREYLKWLAEGNEPDIEPAPEPLPRLIDPRLMMYALKEDAAKYVYIITELEKPENLGLKWLFLPGGNLKENNTDLIAFIANLIDGGVLTQEQVDRILAKSFV